MPTMLARGDPFAAGGVQEGLRDGQLLMELNELCQRIFQRREWQSRCIGPGHELLWSVTLHLHALTTGARHITEAFSGQGSTKKAAQDVAAAAALDALESGWRVRLGVPAPARAQPAQQLEWQSQSSQSSQSPSLSVGAVAATAALHAPGTPVALSRARAPGAALMRLNELCQVNPGWQCQWCDPWRVTEQAYWNATLRVFGAGAAVSEFQGSGRSINGAKDMAAAAAVAALTAHAARKTPKAEQRSLAQVGDAALDLLVVLRAFARGLDVGPADGLRQRMLNNAALGGTPSPATAREAAVGKAICARLEQLTELIKDALKDADDLVLLGQLDAALSDLLQ
jgi:hypothetical protein